MNLIRLRKTSEKTGLSRSSIYQKVSEGTFPQPVKLSTRAVAWVDEEIDRWIRERVKERGEVA